MNLYQITLFMSIIFLLVFSVTQAVFRCKPEYSLLGGMGGAFWCLFIFAVMDGTGAINIDWTLQ